MSAVSYFDQSNWLYFNHVINRALELFPDEAYFYYLKAEGLFALRNAEEPIEYLKKRIELQPGNASFFATCSYYYAYIKDGEASLAFEKEALTLEVEDEMVFAKLGWAAHERGEYDKAIEYLENAVRLNPYHKQNRVEYMAMLQNKYKFYRFLTWPGRLPPILVLVFWIIGWCSFSGRPLLHLSCFILSPTG